MLHFILCEIDALIIFLVSSLLHAHFYPDNGLSNVVLTVVNPNSGLHPNSSLHPDSVLHPDSGQS